MEIYIVTANSQICPIVESWSHSVIRLQNMSDLREQLASEPHPDAVLLIEGGSGVSPETAADLKKKYPELRIIYIANKPDFHNDAILDAFVSMIDAGIYDILYSGDIKPSMIRNLIDHPMTAEDVSFLFELKKESGEAVNVRDTFVSPSELKNVIVVSSAKPGTGISFTASNLAVMIAKYGRVKKDYNPPRVLLMEMGNNTGTGTLLKLNHPQYNIREAMHKIQTAVDDTGKVSGEEHVRKQINDFIHNCCFQTLPELPNLHSLTNASTSLVEVDDFNQYCFFYLMRELSDMFDVIVMDTDNNYGDEFEKTMMKLAKEWLLVVTDDYDAVRVTSKYIKDRSKDGTAGKVRVVLNMMPVGSAKNYQDFKAKDYIDEKKITGTIPILDPVIVYNHLYHGMPVVLDQRYDTLLARIAFTKLANTIWPMENLKQLTDEADLLQRVLK